MSDSLWYNELKQGLRDSKISVKWQFRYLDILSKSSIHLHRSNSASSLEYSFYFALYNLWLFIQLIGIFAGICSGKLGNTTFHNQPADSIPLKPSNYKGFVPLILKTFLFNFSVAMFRFTENCDTDKWCAQGDCKFYNRVRKIPKKC